MFVELSRMNEDSIVLKWNVVFDFSQNCWWNCMVPALRFWIVCLFVWFPGWVLVLLASAWVLGLAVACMLGTCGVLLADV